MDFPWPWNRKYTMNWFLLSLLNHYFDQLPERYSRLPPPQTRFVLSERMTTTVGTKRSGRSVS